MTLRIGLDFDNTLIDYSDVFAKVFVTESARRDITPSELPTGKQAVKQAAIKLAGETFWMSIQGLAYGRGIIDGKLSSGVADFLHTARTERAEIYIVSHKTEYGHFDNSKTNLRTAARDWMEAQGFFDPDGFDLHPSQLFFEGTLPIILMSVFSHHFIPLIIIRHQILFTNKTTGLGNKRHGKHIVTKILVPM